MVLWVVCVGNALHQCRILLTVQYYKQNMDYPYPKEGVNRPSGTDCSYLLRNVCVRYHYLSHRMPDNQDTAVGLR